jgi:cobalamin biosynthesis protein CobD/CbiB
MIEAARAFVLPAFWCAERSPCWPISSRSNSEARSERKQTRNYYITRVTVIFALGVFIVTVPTFTMCFLVAEAFECGYVFGTIMQMLMTQFALGMSSFTTCKPCLLRTP